jgi:NAD(P)-dependent dehydrogenase (short-subunit alcohol dehydrogenase family)
MFTKELAKRLRGTRVTANAVHPGIVRTPMMLSAPDAFKIMSYLSLPFSISPSKGARTIVYLATSDAVATTSGEYFIRCKPRRTTNAFDTEENRALLWDSSIAHAGHRI